MVGVGRKADRRWGDEMWDVSSFYFIKALPDPFPLLSEVRLVVHVYQPSVHSGIQEFAATTGGECAGVIPDS